MILCLLPMNPRQLGLCESGSVDEMRLIVDMSLVFIGFSIRSSGVYVMGLDFRVLEVW